MNPCLPYVTLLGARPGELSDEESMRLAEHLAGCDACQARLADAEALGALLPQALLDEANRRDFSEFADGVLARIPAYAGGARQDAAGERGWRAWLRGHRWAAAGGLLAPALAALALVLYIRAGQPDEPAFAQVEVSAEGRSATVLQTSDGPVVLLGDDDEPAGT